MPLVHEVEERGSVQDREYRGDGGALWDAFQLSEGVRENVIEPELDPPVLEERIDPGGDGGAESKVGQCSDEMVVVDVVEEAFNIK